MPREPRCHITNGHSIWLCMWSLYSLNMRVDRSITFCAAVRSSAKLVARFLAHCPSCMAAAWSVTVGTDDLAEDTILLPGCEDRDEAVVTSSIFNTGVILQETDVQSESKHYCYLKEVLTGNDEGKLGTFILRLPLTAPHSLNQLRDMVSYGLTHTNDNSVTC